MPQEEEEGEFFSCVDTGVWCALYHKTDRTLHRSGRVNNPDMPSMFGLLLSLVLSLGLSAAACTYEQILLCEQHIILGQQGKPRDCNSEEVPSYDELAPAPDTCCPSCHNEPRPYCMYLSSELCAANEEPTTSEDSGYAYT